MLVFLKLLLAHLITDFLLQNKWFLSKKRESLLWISLHSIIIFPLVAIVLFNVDLTLLLITAIFAVAIFHFVLDAIKTRVARDSLFVLLLDQLLHLLVISATALFVEQVSLSIAISTGVGWLNQLQLLIILSALVLLTVAGSVLVSAIMRSFTWQFSVDEAGGLKNAGFYIGLFERIIVFVFALNNNIEAIGFIFAAKSIIRFPEVREEKHFAEYYLVGTLSSFTLALLLGIATKSLIASVA